MNQENFFIETNVISKMLFVIKLKRTDRHMNELKDATTENDIDLFVKKRLARKTL